MPKKHQPITRFSKVNEQLNLNRLYNPKKLSQDFILNFLYYVSDPSTNYIKASETISKSIQALTRWNLRSIEKSLKGLCDAGYIKRIDSKTYQINPHCMNKKNYIYSNLGYDGHSPKIKPEFRDLFNKIKDHFDIKPIPRKTNEREKMLEEKIESLEDSIKSQQAMLEKMMSMLSPEQKEQVKPHLTLVKSNH